MKTVGKYLRELSIVVIGVFITFIISFWVYNRNNEKDLNEYLTTVKLELETNAKNVKGYARYLQKSVDYANYLALHNKKSMNKDSLYYYSRSDENGCGAFNIYLYSAIQTQAFEMFKISGAMRQIKDKELLLSLWETYNQLDDLKLFLDICFQTKREEAMKELQLIVNGKPSAIPMQTFYATDLPQAMVQRCDNVAKTLQETVAKLDKAL